MLRLILVIKKMKPLYLFFQSEVKEKRRLAKIRMKAESDGNMKQIDTVKGNEVCYG